MKGHTMETATISINEIQNPNVWENLSWNQLNAVMCAIEKAKENVKIKEIKTLQTKIEEAQKALLALGFQASIPVPVVTPVTPVPVAPVAPVVASSPVPASYEMLYREVIILLAKYEQRKTIWSFAEETFKELDYNYHLDFCFASFYQKVIKYFNLHISRKFSQKMSRAKSNPENWNKPLPTIVFDVNKNVSWDIEYLEEMKNTLLKHDYVRNFYTGGGVSQLIGLK